MAAEWYVAPSASGVGTLASPGSLTNAMAHAGWAASIAPGDTVYLRAGTYSIGTNRWFMDFSGTAGNLVTWRNYTNELAVVDFPVDFGSRDYHRFQGYNSGFQFTDSTSLQKGTNEAAGYFDAGSGSHCEWINLVIHDVGGTWTGTAGGAVVRGCVIWRIGSSYREHIIYPYCKNFSGNIVGWCAGDVFELGTAESVVTSNIIFGTSVTVDIGTTSILMTQSTNGVIAWNRIYETQAQMRGIQIQDSNPGIVTSNIVVARNPFRLFNLSADLNFSGNTAFDQFLSQSDTIVRTTNVSTWTVNNNAYWASNTVRFSDMGVVKTFDTWRADYPSYDTLSTSTNGAHPPDSVTVFPNSDESKRAHIAIYNWTQAHNVTVDVSGVLASGDAYALYSAQNYLAGPIKSGTVSGTTITVPMTNLTTATILYATNLIQPSPTSPIFGAFVLQHSTGVMNVNTLNIDTLIIR